ncbi:MAG: hypothetical protein AAGK74_20920 [Chloroflexota bacterium]
MPVSQDAASGEQCHRVLASSKPPSAWAAYPKTKQVEIYTPDATSRTYNADDTISGGDLLPGLNLAVADIFDV